MTPATGSAGRAPEPAPPRPDCIRRADESRRALRGRRAAGGLWHFTGRSLHVRNRDDLIAHVAARATPSQRRALTTAATRAAAYNSSRLAQDMRVAREVLLSAGFDSIRFTHHLDR